MRAARHTTAVVVQWDMRDHVEPGIITGNPVGIFRPCQEFRRRLEKPERQAEEEDRKVALQADAAEWWSNGAAILEGIYRAATLVCPQRRHRTPLRGTVFSDALHYPGPGTLSTLIYN
jgi:hypothetical protein